MMVLLVAMAAIAIDVGAGFNERRQNQTAADVGVMAGAITAINGQAAVRTQVLDLVERNLTEAFTAAEYQAIWEGCVDPVADRNTEAGDDFVALPPPTGWTPTDAADWCISVDGSKGLLRVRVPDQLTDTSFAQVIGTDTLTTNAFAVAGIDFGPGAGGVLPFGLGNGAGGGEIQCLSSGPTGNSSDPCTGSNSGNYGAIIIRQFGNVDLGTSENCPNVANPGRTLAQNIATGADHLLVTTPDTSAANEVRDYVRDTPFPNTVDVDPGFPNNSTEQGLVGPVPGGFTPRLQQSGPLTTIFGYQVNNTPLWTYLLPETDGSANNPNPDFSGVTATTADDAPASCDPTTFVAGTMDWDGDLVPDDYNGDGTPDQGNSWQHVAICFRQYVGDFNFDGDTSDAVDTAPYSQVIINSSIVGNASRFAYVPQFHESMSNPQWKHIQRFRAVYLQSTAWKRGNSYLFHHPGEPCVGCSGNYSLWHLSAFTFPDAALPEDLRGDPIPGSLGLNPFSASLER